MMGLDQEQVWIGSQDSVIYIINTRSMLCHKQLTEHRGEVTDFALEKLNPENRSKWVFDSDNIRWVNILAVVVLTVIKTLDKK